MIVMFASVLNIEIPDNKTFALNTNKTANVFKNVVYKVL